MARSMHDLSLVREFRRVIVLRGNDLFNNVSCYNSLLPLTHILRFIDGHIKFS